MKTLLCIIFSLAMMLGALISRAQTPVCIEMEQAFAWAGDESVANEVQAYHMGTGYIGPVGNSEELIKGNGDTTKDFAEIVIPVPLNQGVVQQDIIRAHASECEFLDGVYSFEVYVDESGNYVSHHDSSFDPDNKIGRHLKNLVFDPARMGETPVSAWVEVVLDFDAGR